MAKLVEIRFRILFYSFVIVLCLIMSGFEGRNIKHEKDIGQIRKSNVTRSNTDEHIVRQETDPGVKHCLGKECKDAQEDPHTLAHGKPHHRKSQGPTRHHGHGSKKRRRHDSQHDQKGEEIAKRRRTSSSGSEHTGHHNRQQQEDASEKAQRHSSSAHEESNVHMQSRHDQQLQVKHPAASSKGQSQTVKRRRLPEAKEVLVVGNKEGIDRKLTDINRNIELQRSPSAFDDLKDDNGMQSQPVAQPRRRGYSRRRYGYGYGVYEAVTRLEQRMRPKLNLAVQKMTRSMKNLLQIVQKKVTTVRNNYTNVHMGARHDISEVMTQLQCINEENNRAYDALLDVSQLVRFVHLRAYERRVAPVSMTMMPHATHFPDFSQNVVRANQTAIQARRMLSYVQSIKSLSTAQENNYTAIFNRMKGRKARSLYVNIARYKRKIERRLYGQIRGDVKKRIMTYQHKINGVTEHFIDAKNLSYLAAKEIWAVRRDVQTNAALRNSILGMEPLPAFNRTAAPPINMVEVERLTTLSYQHARQQEWQVENMARKIIPILQTAKRYIEQQSKSGSDAWYQVQAIARRLSSIVKRLDRTTDELRVYLGDEDILRERCEDLLTEGRRGDDEDMVIDCEPYVFGSGTGGEELMTVTVSAPTPIHHKTTSISSTASAITSPTSTMSPRSTKTTRQPRSSPTPPTTTLRLQTPTMTSQPTTPQPTTTTTPQSTTPQTTKPTPKPTPPPSTTSAPQPSTPPSTTPTHQTMTPQPTTTTPRSTTPRPTTPQPTTPQPTTPQPTTPRPTTPQPTTPQPTTPQPTTPQPTTPRPTTSQPTTSQPTTPQPTTPQPTTPRPTTSQPTTPQPTTPQPTTPQPTTPQPTTPQPTTPQTTTTTPQTITPRSTTPTTQPTSPPPTTTTPQQTTPRPTTPQPTTTSRQMSTDDLNTTTADDEDNIEFSGDDGIVTSTTSRPKLTSLVVSTGASSQQTTPTQEKTTTSTFITTFVVPTTIPSTATTTSTTTTISTTIEEGSGTEDPDFGFAEEKEKEGGSWWSFGVGDDPNAGSDKAYAFRNKLHNKASGEREKSDALFARSVPINSQQEVIVERWEEIKEGVQSIEDYVTGVSDIETIWATTKEKVISTKSRIAKISVKINSQEDIIRNKTQTAKTIALAALERAKASQNSQGSAIKDAELFSNILTEVQRVQSNMQTIQELKKSNPQPCLSVQKAATDLRNNIAELRKKIDRARAITSALPVTVAMLGESYRVKVSSATAAASPMTSFEVCIKPEKSDMPIASFHGNGTVAYDLLIEESFPVVAMRTPDGEQQGTLKSSVSMETSHWYNLRITRIGHTVNIYTTKLGHEPETIREATAFPNMIAVQKAPTVVHIGGSSNFDSDANGFTGCIGDVVVDGQTVGLAHTVNGTEPLNTCTTGCGSSRKPSMVFDGDGYVKFPLSTLLPYYRVDGVFLRFSTRQREGILLLLNDQQQHLQILLSVSGGAIHLEARTKRGTTVLRSINDTFADGDFHIIDVNVQAKEIEATLNGASGAFSPETTTQEITSAIDDGIYVGGLGSKSQLIAGKTKLRSLTGCISTLKISNNEIPMYMLQESRNVIYGSCSDSVWFHCVRFTDNSKPVVLEKQVESNRIYVTVSTDSVGTVLNYKRKDKFNIELLVNHAGVTAIENIVKNEVDLSISPHKEAQWMTIVIVDQVDNVKINLNGTSVNLPHQQQSWWWANGEVSPDYQLTVGANEEEETATFNGGIAKLIVNDQIIDLTRKVNSHKLQGCRKQIRELPQMVKDEKPVC